MKQQKTTKVTPDALESKSKGIKDKSNTIRPRKVKQPSKRTVKDKAWRAFSQFIRTRDCLMTTGTPDRGKCITCGFEFPFKQLQAGHFIPGRHNANLFSEEGTHAQCRSCNIWGNGKPLEYRRAILDLYGDGYDEVLEKESREIKKFSVEDLTSLTEYYIIETDKLIRGRK